MPPRLFDFCRLRVAQAAGAFQEGLGAAEIEIHVEPDGQMVGVVGDVERHDFFLFSVFRFHEREDKTTVFRFGIFHLEGLLAAVDDVLRLALPAVGHDELDAVALLVFGSVERAGAHHHAEHVEGTLVAFKLAALRLVRVALVEHVDLAGGRGVAVPHFLLAVGVALKGSLAVVERGEVEPGVAHEGVAHDEELVGRFGAAGNQVVLVGRLPVVDGFRGVHGSGAHLDPHELPVEVEVIDERFAAFEGRILG